MLYFTLWSHEPALHEPVYRARPLSPELDRFLPRKSQKSRFLTQKLINYEHPWNAGRPVYRFSPKIAKQVLSQKISNSTIYRGFAEKTPGVFFFFSASLRSAEGKIYIYAPPIETNFNILKQNKKKYLKYRLPLFYLCSSGNLNYIQKIQEKPQGWVFFLIGSIKKGGKKPHPLGFFPRNPCIKFFSGN